MKKTSSKIIKFILILFLVLLIPACLIFSASRFIHVGDRVYYWDHTHILRDTWKVIQGARCRFDSDGSLHEGWFSEKGHKSYLIGGIPVTGVCKTGGREYYFDQDGLMQTGLVPIGDSYAYYGEDGVRKTGWITLSGNTYYFTPDGIKTGWFDYDGARYYFSQKGIMAAGWNKIQGKMYNFDEKGRLRRDGWFEDDYGSYYLHKDGHAATGRTEIGNVSYCFSERGLLLRNKWVGNSFYGSDGSLQTNRDIDGLWVDEKGDKVFYGSYGSGGSLYIPTVQIQVPAYLTPGGSKGQEITDRADSAASLTSFNKPVIADHKNQGFEQIKSCLPATTRAFLLTEDTVTEYICSAICTGTNTEHDILDSSGVSIDDRKADLVLYTCNEDWRHVTIVFFRKM